MEILFIGIIIVALMAYASTKIKKSAKAAYELEVFENEEFTITKPEGFIIPYNEKSKYAVEIYSKDFGDDESKRFNHCQALVSVENNFKKNSSTKKQQTEREVTTQIWTKILGNRESNKNYKLEITLLDEYKDLYLDKIDSMLDSFELK